MIDSNDTIKNQLNTFVEKGNFTWMFLSLILTLAWFFYLTFWNSRLIGLLITFILRRFTNYNIKIGSVSLSVLGGKLMLKDFYMVHKDYSFRSYDIIVIFNYWKWYNVAKKEASSRSLTIYSFKPEFHLFNRTEVYKELLQVVINVAEKRRMLTMANLKSSVTKKSSYIKQREISEDSVDGVSTKAKQEESSDWFDWQSLFPNIIFHIENMTVCFGNHLLPTTCCLKCESANIKYSKRESTYSIDRYQHFVVADCVSFVASFIPTINHKSSYIHRSVLKEMQSCQIFSFGKSKIVLERDEPGDVTLEPEQLQMTNGNIEVLRTWPKYAIRIDVVKDCKIVYNSWADSQKDVLWKFFYPTDFTMMKVTPIPQFGNKRIWKSFDISFKSHNNTDVDLCFGKEKLHVNTNQKSFIDIIIPWIVSETGYTSTIKGSLPKVTCQLSHLCSDVLESTSLDLDIQMRYPRVWNALQIWNINIKLNQAKCKLVYDYKNFFTAYLAFHPKHVVLQVIMPFIDFLPNTVPYQVKINATDVTCQLSIPETCTSLYIMKELHNHMRVVDADCKPLPHGQLFKMTTEFVKGQEDRPINKRRNIHWIDCVFSPNVTVDILYHYHPMPKVKDLWEFVPLEVKNHAVLSHHHLLTIDEDPLNFLRPEGQLQNGPSARFLSEINLDASYMEADSLNLDVRVNSGVVCLYGSLLRHVVHIKENYFGENQVPINFNEKQINAVEEAKIISDKVNSKEVVDPRQYRPFAAKINLYAHNVQGHLMKHCSNDATMCPTAFIDCIGFEMDKGHEETKLQVIISPILIIVVDSYQERREAAIPLSRGSMVLEGIQVRGHALFTGGLHEYSWSIEATLGELTGQCTSHQLNTLVHCIQSLVFLIADQENDILPSRDFEYCQHLWPRTECPKWQHKHLSPCPREADVKYKLLRIIFDGLQMNFVEESICLQVTIAGPVHLVNCNLHGPTTTEGISAVVPELSLKQYVKPLEDTKDSGMDNWVESGSLSLGDVVLNAGIALPLPECRQWQDQFIKYHDKKTKRLWFLWNDLIDKEQDLSFVCGCIGGCAFFGENYLNNRFSRGDSSVTECNKQAATFVSKKLLGKTELLTFGQSLFERDKWIFERHTSKTCCDINSGWLMLRDKSEREEIMRNYVNNGSVSSESLSSAQKATIIPMEDEEPILESSQDEPVSRVNERAQFIMSDDPLPIRRRYSLKSLISCASTSSSSSDKLKHDSVSIGNTDDEKNFFNKAYHCEDNNEEESSDEIRAKYVDLRGQLHNTITESNLLYLAYQRHLPTYRCSQWAVPVTLKNYWIKCHQGRLPSFHYIQEGFTPKLIVNRTNQKRNQRPTKKGYLDYLAGCRSRFTDHDSVDSGTKDTTAKTTVSVKFNDAINVFLTPLFVECMTRFVTILTPELTHSFTSAVVNRLHFQSVNLTLERCKPMKVSSSDPNTMSSGNDATAAHREQQRDRTDTDQQNSDALTSSSENVFESASHWVQRKVTSVLAPNISGLTPLVEENPINEEGPSHIILNMEGIPLATFERSNTEPNEATTLVSQILLDPTRISRTQFSVNIDRINVCVMQLYAIEDIVNSDTLVPGLHDLTCVSLMSFCLDTALFQVLVNTRSEPDTENLHRSIKIKDLKSDKNPIKSCQESDGFRRTEEMITNIEMKRVHGQLRRLTRDSQFSPEVLLTAIPFNTSKVFFAFESDPGGALSNFVQLDERSAGWIMFECGLEDLVLRGVRRRGFPDRVDDYTKKVLHRDNSSEDSSENHNVPTGDDIDCDSKSNKNALLCQLKVRQVWLNFPAPKKLPNKKRINITRDDWNFLSTATPMIKAWMDPCDRLIRACNRLKHVTERRQLAVLACLMTHISHVDVSHFSNIMFGHRDKAFNCYDKWRTDVARAVRYEPTCQIFTLIRMYLQSDPTMVMNIERSLKDDTLPQIVTLQRGILALTRHWQHLVEVDPHVKSTLYNGFQKVTNAKNMNQLSEGGMPRIYTSSGLLHVPTATSQLFHNYSTDEMFAEKSPQSDAQHDEETNNNNESNDPMMQRFLQDANKACSSEFMKDLNETNQVPCDFHLNSQDEPEDHYPITTPLVHETEYQAHILTQKNNAAFVTNQFKQANFLRAHYRYMEEAQKVFRPLLEIVGLHVKGVRRTTLMKKFGGYFCANGLLDTFRIDIIQSESNPLSQYNKKPSNMFNSKTGDTLSSLPRFTNARQKSFKNQTASRSTFLCQSFSTRVTMRDVIGFEDKKSEKESPDELDIKPTTTQVYLTIQIQAIQQHINMPLLRLVHQFVTMVYCANDTKEDLDNRRKKNWPVMYPMRHKKQNSKGSSNDTVTTGDTTNSSGARSHEIYYTTVQSTLKSDTIKQYGKDEELCTTEIDNDDIPLCWRQMYSLLDLYSRVPDLKTVNQPVPNPSVLFNINRRSFSLQNNVLNVPIFGGPHMPTIEEVNETISHNSLNPMSQYSDGYYKRRISEPVLGVTNHNNPKTESPNKHGKTTTDPNANDRGQMAIQKFTFQWVHGQRVPLVIFCSGKVKKVGLSAVLSELNLEGKLINLHCSYTQISRVKGRGMFTDKSSEHSLSVHCGEIETVLFEEIPTHKLDVVHIKGSPSHCVYSSKHKNKYEKNSCFFGLGKFDFVLPHHPVKLKDMMQRSAKRISTTMTELFRPYNSMVSYYNHAQLWECGGSSGVTGPGDKLPDPNQPVHESTPIFPNIIDRDYVDSNKPTGPIINTTTVPVATKHTQMTITGMSKGLTISVALHQSLMARYQIDPVYMSGTVDADYGKVNVSVKNHYLSFISENPPPGVPKSVTIKLPNIMLGISKKTSTGGKFLLNQDKLTQDLVTEQGSYIDILASVSTLEHTLTTYLLSYIVVTVQLFMKEINEVIQKMAGEDQMNITHQIPDDLNKSISNDNKLLNRAARGNTKFSFRVSMDGIRLIATTKSGAVKFETQQIDVELSNRVHSSVGDVKTRTCSMDNRSRLHTDTSNKTGVVPDDLNMTYEYKETIFVFALIENISVELGQLCKDIVYTEKTPDFKTLAFFKTAVSLRSLLTEETAIRNNENNREAYLISLIRPIFWVKPIAFDRGLLMWKLYKEEFDKWKKTMTLHSQAITPSGSFQGHQPRAPATSSHQATTPSSSSTGHGTVLGMSGSRTDTLFLQLIIDDLGICVPLCPAGNIESDARSSLVVTLKNVRLSSCFKQEFASEGEFIDFCIRFDEEFNDGSDDWKPDAHRIAVTSDGKEHLVVMNGCVVENGTFQVCSKLQTGDLVNGMLVEVVWQMCGLDSHLDWNMGKRLKTLSTIMTSVINVKDNGDVCDYQSIQRHRENDIGLDCIVLQGQSSKLFDSPRDHIKLNSLIEIIDDTVDHTNIMRRKSLEIHKPKRNKLTQFFIKPKSKSIKRSGSESVRRSQLAYPSPPIRQSTWRTNLNSDLMDSRMGSLSASNASTLRRHTARQSISEEELARRVNEPYSPNSPTYGRPSTLNINNRYTPHEINRADSVYFDAAENVSLGSNYQDDFDEFEDAVSDSRNSSANDIINIPTQIAPRIVPELSVPVTKIGLELKLHIHIDSGRCVLHPKISQTDVSKTMDKFMNPLSQHYSYKRNPVMSSLNSEEEQLNALLKRYQAYLNFSAMSSDISVFYIPAVDLQLYYSSKSANTANTIVENSMVNKKSDKEKKADLYAYVSLKKLPKDLLVHPSLIDFVEQSLEALPVLPEDLEFDKSSEHSNNTDDDGTSLLTESLPVDVIVHINVEPSTLRFVCIPTSPVQCLMSLPSVDLIFTTKRNQFDVVSAKKESNQMNVSNKIITTGAKMQVQHLPEHSQLFEEGGLSVTGILKEFKISIFHPYGTTPGPIDASHSLTLAVEDVCVNLCRMRQVTVPNESSTTTATAASDGLTTNRNIRMSAICDIGSAQFKFDIRRSQEILAIPMAWYRSSLARRLFLGDEPMPIPPQANETDNKVLNDYGLDDVDNKSNTSVGPDLRMSFEKSYHRRLSSGDKNKYNLAFDSSQVRMRPKLMSTSTTKTDSATTRTIKEKEKPKPSTNDTSKSCSMTSTWQTLLLFAFNLNNVDIEMAMGSAMGITNLNLEKIYSSGHLKMDSNKSKNNQIKVGIREAKFYSQGGIVGGEMSLSGLDVALHVKEDFNSEPEHCLTGVVDHFEIRIEYMNTNILLGRISLVKISLHDEWQNSVARQKAKISTGAMLPPSRDDNPCVVILVAGEIKWDQCQFAIGRTTTPDLIKSGKKLMEYFTEQFKDSRNRFGLRQHPGKKKVTTTASSRTEDTYDFIYRVFQRHWQSTFTLAMTNFLRLPCYSEDSPEIHSVLPAGCLNLGIVGGSLQLIGRALAVACFGGNFKSAPDWAVFNIQYPTISFETEAQKISCDEPADSGATSLDTLDSNIGEVINIRQVLSLELGGQAQCRPQMVYIVKVKRGRDNAASTKIHPRIDEWFHFAFKPADHAIVAFLKANNPQSEKQNVPMVSFTNPHARKSERPNPLRVSNDADLLFIIPSISSRLTTDHRQSMISPQSADDSIDAEVKLSFHTDFHGVLQLGIIDVPWLPTLINSYIQERIQDSVDCPDQRASTGSPIVQDMRKYDVIHWNLSPECRWLQANQVSVPAFDQILKMVGFHKARTTIPKWLQRGVLDHLDNLLSMLVARVINLMKEDPPTMKSFDQLTDDN